MKNSKSQNPTSKQMPIYKTQIPNGFTICNLWFGAWGLFGFWSLVLGIFFWLMLSFSGVSWAGELSPKKLENYFSEAIKKTFKGDRAGAIKTLKEAQEDLQELELVLKVQGGRIPKMLRAVIKDIDQDIKTVELGKRNQIEWIQNTSQRANNALAMYLCRQDSRYRCVPRQCLTPVGNYHAIHQTKDFEDCR